MDVTFEKESIWIDWIPVTLLLTMSALFAVSVCFLDSMPMILAGAVGAILLALGPMMIAGYLRSFRCVRVSGNTITVVTQNRIVDYSVPADIRRLDIDADDLQIGFEQNGHRFLLRSRFLNNKVHFHQLFDQMLTDNPPPKEHVRLEASILEMMEKVKRDRE